MYRAIMVPLDGSAFGEHALPLALGIARRTCAQVHLVHVRTPAAEAPAPEDHGTGEQASTAIDQERIAVYLRELATYLSERWEIVIKANNHDNIARLGTDSENAVPPYVNCAKAGFTVVEFVFVLLLLGIMGVTASGLFSNADYAREAADAEQLRMDLRYAQQRAMGSLSNIKVILKKGPDTYELPAGMVFASGENRIKLESDLKTSPNVIFLAQTGLPKVDKVYQYKIGESSKVKKKKKTGMIQ